jgi:uncharacterized membrane protein
MENQLTPLPPNPTKVATKWALISLAVGIVITYAIQFSGLDINSPVKYLGYIPFIGGLILTQKEFKEQLGGFLTFGQGFSAGFRFALFNGLLLAVFTYLYLAILSPDVFAKAMETTRAAMVAKGMSDEQVEKAMGMAMKFGPIGGAFFLAIWYAILGAIIALIGASIFKKERSAYDVDDYVAPEGDAV